MQLMAVITRAQAGLVAPTRIYQRPTYPATHVVIHHGASATPEDEAGEMAAWRSYQRYHMSVKGWTDVAYSFGQGNATGNRYIGRGWQRQSGATGNPQDTYSVSICAIGNFDAHQTKPSAELKEGIARTIFTGIRKGHLVPIEQLVISGHRDEKPGTTACPGDRLHRHIPTIRERVVELLMQAQELENALTAPDGPEPVPDPGLTLEQRVAALERAVFG